MNGKKFTIESAGPKIEAFLRKVLAAGGFDLKFEIGLGANLFPDFENPDIVVRFRGHDVDLLLSNKAEMLLALEQITMEMLRMAPEEHSFLQFDANDYRMLRIEELRLSAVTAADRVKRTKTPFQFSPMNSRERRILHLALRNEPEVRSESAGMGPYRQVVIYPAGMPSLPASAFEQRPAPPRGGPRGGGRGGPERRR